MTWDEWDPENDREWEEYSRDSAIDEARVQLERFLQQKSNEIFYMSQLQVLFEKTFFHWITSKAVNELLRDKVLRSEVRDLVEGQPQGSRVKFVFSPKNRFVKRAIGRKLDLIRRFSVEPVGRACGRHAEILFSRFLLKKGFKQVAENATEHENETWTATGHDLDYIFEKDGLTYGCEIKNRFEYINRTELDAKLRMCKHLRLIPFFIMRASPKSYNKQIIDAGGFVKIFVAHIYPYGFEELVKDIRKEFQLPVDCPTDLPDTILNTFLQWHRKMSGGKATWSNSYSYSQRTALLRQIHSADIPIAYAQPITSLRETYVISPQIHLRWENTLAPTVGHPRRRYASTVTPAQVFKLTQS